jgi:hypothetical protein
MAQAEPGGELARLMMGKASLTVSVSEKMAPAAFFGACKRPLFLPRRAIASRDVQWTGST